MSQRPCALVTGASRGIGRAIAVALAREGYDLAGNSTSYDPADETTGLAVTKQLVEDAGAGFLPIPADISDLATHGPLLQSVMERFGRVDLLVNNAGIAPPERLDFLDTTVANYDRVLAVNLRAPFFLTQCVARELVRQVDGGDSIRPAVIFITSVSAHMSSPSRTEYCVAKAGLSHLSRICADRLSGYNIAVYEVRPGVIATDMTAPVQQQYDSLIAEGLIPQGRWGQPEDIAGAVAALARGDFSYATGSVFEVSGGLNISSL